MAADARARGRGRAAGHVARLPARGVHAGVHGRARLIGALAEDVAVDEVAVRVVSCDAAPVLRRVREELALPEPLTLLSDFWPHGAACRALDVFDAETGRPRRVSVLLDADGVEAARVVAAPGQARTRGEHEAATRDLLVDR